MDDKVRMLEGLAMILMAAQAVAAPHPPSADEESLVWTTLADPDPYFVPPPVPPEQREW